MPKKIIIVGGGIAGLSAGCYARFNGFDTSIFEMHNIPGGLCTAWERKGYRFDISTHILTGAVGGPLHQMWKELGVVDNIQFHTHEQISLIEGMGCKLPYTTDRKQMEEALLDISPEDEPLIKEFIRLIFGRDMMGGASLKPGELQHIGDTLKMVPVVLPMLGKIVKYGRVSLQEFASRFRHPFLKQAIRFFVDAPGWPMPDFPMIVLSGFIRTGMKEAPAPLGGSQGLANHVADLYRVSGGTLNLKSKVTSLLMEKERVTGIQLEDGTRHYADHVIWAGDGHTLIYDMLEGKYLSKQITHMYENWKPVNPIIHVAMGVNRDFSNEPHCIIFEPSEPIDIAGMENNWLTFRHHCFDPSMAPKGKSAVEVWYTTEYGYWEELYKDKKAYKAEKKRIADYTVSQLERRWPGFSSQLELIDVPTPATYHRYTGNWKGSPDGWYCNMENYTSREPVRTLPGLEGLKMVGQWTAPYTGVVLASLTGRQAIQMICKEENESFRTEKTTSGSE